MKIGDLVRLKEPYYQKSYGAGVILEKYYSSVDYGYVVFFRDAKVHVRQEELEVVSENR